MTNSRRMSGRFAPLPIAVILAWCAVMGGCKIGEDKAFSIGVLFISPNPAQQGDVVTFTFDLIVIPERSFTVTAFIDDMAHTSQTFQQRQNGLFDFEVGDAGDLIAQYGLGTHTGRVEVLIAPDDELLANSARNFELQ